MNQGSIKRRSIRSDGWVKDWGDQVVYRAKNWKGFNSYYLQLERLRKELANG